MTDVNSFDAETSLAKHRTSVQFYDMLLWLQTAKPNGSHPLPIPIPLQIMDISFVRPIVNHILDPFIVLTQVGCRTEDFFDLKARIIDFGTEIKDTEEVLLFSPGTTEKEVWIIHAYRNSQDFEERGLSRKKILGVEGHDLVTIWNEDVLGLKDLA
ncbi:MAG: hypothetical protein Q9223_004305 [Gallowayella weberi]